MKGFDNSSYIMVWAAFNLLAIFFLFAAVKRPKTGRLLFFLLFAWACWMNFTTVRHSPQAYLDYADLALSSWYSGFIRGWFSKHTALLVGLIAACQGLIAFSMLLRGWLYKTGCAGAIIFLVSIAPLGMGSGFPCTLIFAAALIVLFPKCNEFWWKNHKLTQFVSR